MCNWVCFYAVSQHIFKALYFPPPQDIFHGVICKKAPLLPPTSDSLKLPAFKIDFSIHDEILQGRPFSDYMQSNQIHEFIRVYLLAFKCD